MKRVWVNGTFDILHIGHIKLLEFAKGQGDYLCVGIDSDRRIKQLKGPDRPVNNELARMEFLLAIKFVDKVVLFDNDDELIAQIKGVDPDIFVIGSDYKNKKIIGVEFARQLIYFKKLEGFSSTNIINGNMNNWKSRAD